MSPELVDIPVSLRGPGRNALIAMGATVTLLLIGGLLAPLNSGAIAPGEIIPAGYTKTIQHLDGGIVRYIAAKEGGQVAKGRLLIELDDTEAKAKLAIAAAEEATQHAIVVRLEAERDGEKLPPLKLISPSVETQIRLFEARRTALHKELEGFDNRIQAAIAERESWQKKELHLRAMTADAEEESKLNQSLYEKNFISRPRLLQLNSRRSEMEANMAESGAEAARALQKVTDAEAAVAKLKNEWLNNILEELRKAQESHAITTEKLTVAREGLARTKIVAPQDGTVNGLRYTTVGGVIPPGGTIMEITPSSVPLIVEARLSPDDINAIHPGLLARVRLSAYKARWHFALRGRVVSVSPDTFKDDKTGRSFYKVTIEIPDNELKGEDRTVLVPGMLAQAEIVTGERSALRYLLDPVIDSFGRAMKEK